MKSIAIIIGAIALLGTIAPPLLYLVGQMGQDAMQLIMLIACVFWFITAPVWMKAE